MTGVQTCALPIYHIADQPKIREGLEITDSLHVFEPRRQERLSGDEAAGKVV